MLQIGFYTWSREHDLLLADMSTGTYGGIPVIM